MHVSLEQAIEIHARALVHRQKQNAVHSARDLAKTLERLGDSEGYEVWLKVASAAADILAVATKADSVEPARR